MYLESMFKKFQGIHPRKLFTYAPATGLPELRTLWAAKIREENAVFYCGAWAVLLAGGILVIQSMGWQIYDADTASVWLLAGAAALAGAVWQTVEFVKRMGGNVDEINIGTIV